MMLIYPDRECNGFLIASPLQRAFPLYCRAGVEQQGAVKPSSQGMVCQRPSLHPSWEALTNEPIIKHRILLRFLPSGVLPSDCLLISIVCCSFNEDKDSRIGGGSKGSYAWEEMSF